MAVLQESLPSVAAESQDSRPAPKGRPPKGYIWCGDGYVHRDSLVPFSRAEHEALMKEAWRQMRLHRYSVDARGFRTKRVQEQANARLAAGAKPRRRRLQNGALPRSPVQEVNRCSDKSSTT